MEPSSVVVIGLDGATFDLIEPWVQQGRLPNLARLMSSGAWGRLRSTMPPVTAPAWTSFATGKNPGKHGIYDFVQLDVGSGKLTYSNSRHCQEERLWDILSRQGKRVCVVNVPMTYPPHPVNGILITGMMTPGLESEFAYPPEIQEEVKTAFPDYQISVTAGKDLSVYLDSLKRMVHGRARLATSLLQREPWDFFMVVFTATDLVQHLYWGAMRDPDHPFAHAIRDIYELVDARIGELLAVLPANATCFLMSDHGAGPIRSQVHINRWLEEEGYLAYRTDDAPWPRRFGKWALVNAFIFWRKHVPLGWRTRIRDLSPKIQNLGVSERIETIAQVPIDWSRTRAYHWGTFANIRVNLRGRERHGIVSPGGEYESVREDLIRRLLELKDPETGAPAVDRVFRREELYRGPAFERAPDLLIQWADEAYWSDARFGKRSERVFESRYHVRLLSNAISAIHKRDGIFIAWGPGVRSRSIEEADITDLAPTLLYCLGLPIPEDVDGRPLVEIFEDAFRDGRMASFEAAQGPSYEGSEDVFSEEDVRKVEERLKDMGYLG